MDHNDKLDRLKLFILNIFVSYLHVTIFWLYFNTDFKNTRLERIMSDDFFLNSILWFLIWIKLINFCY